MTTTSILTPPRSPFLTPSKMNKINSLSFNTTTTTTTTTTTITTTAYSSESSGSTSTSVSGSSTPTSSTTSLILNDTSEHTLNNQDHPLSHILVLYHKATSALLLRQLATAYSTCVEALELLSKTNRIHGLDQVTESISVCRSYFVLKQKLWILNITIFGTMLSDHHADDQSCQSQITDTSLRKRKTLGNTSNRGNPEKLVKDLWRRLMEDYGGVEGDVDIQVVVAFTLLCINQNMYLFSKQATEGYLATIPEGMLIHLETAAGALPNEKDTKSPLMIHYERLVELYVVHILAKLHEWEFAKQFLVFNHILSDSTKQTYNNILVRLEKKSSRQKKTLTKKYTGQSTANDSLTHEFRSTTITKPVMTSIVSSHKSDMIKGIPDHKRSASSSLSSQAESHGLDKRKDTSKLSTSVLTFQGRFWIFVQRYIEMIKNAGINMRRSQVMVLVGLAVFLSTLSQSQARASGAFQMAIEKVAQTVRMGASA